jgi:hypothetical protein
VPPPPAVRFGPGEEARAQGPELEVPEVVAGGIVEPEIGLPEIVSPEIVLSVEPAAVVGGEDVGP